MKRLTAILTLLSVTALVGTGEAAVVFSGSAGNLAASAAFDYDANTNLLTVVLTNTSMFDVVIPAEVLTAVFFDIAGFPPATLTPLSAALTPGSTVFFGPDGGGNMGGEYAYASGLSGAPGGAVLGTSSAGFGLFGNPNFNGPNLQNPAAVDGLNYGITSAGDNLATGNAAVTGNVALIKNSVTFTLTASDDFALTDISNVSFQYGTALDEPNVPYVPEPMTLLGLGTGLAVLGLVRRRRN